MIYKTEFPSDIQNTEFPYEVQGYILTLVLRFGQSQHGSILFICYYSFNSITEMCLNGLMKVKKKYPLVHWNTNMWSNFLDSPYDFKNSSIFGNKWRILKIPTFNLPILKQGVANFSYKKPKSKYFRLCRLYCLCRTRLCNYSMNAAIDNSPLAMCSHVPIKTIVGQDLALRP